jgi:site-specific DNA-methyltransferase (adenine-specific)
MVPGEIKEIVRYGGKGIQGRIVQGDALDFLRTIKTGSASLVFLDPPFNLGKVYTPLDVSLDQKPEQDYRRWMGDILVESTRILEDGATLYLYHIPVWAMRFGTFLESRLHFKHWIAVSMKNSFMRGKRLYPAHYALLMFTKGPPNHFTRPRIEPKRCRHCKEYIKDYGGYRHIIEKQGINLSDFWEDLSPVRHSNRKNRIGNELPLLLFSRIFEISGGRPGHYVDPFAGGGTGVVEAANVGLRFSGCDIVRENCTIIKRRLDELNSIKKTGAL